MITDRCNLRCGICNRNWYEDYIGGKGRFLDLVDLEKLRKAIEHAEVVGLTGFGESFLHPRLHQIVDYICGHNPKKDVISIITNGTLLSRSHALALTGRLNRFAISVNAADDQAYRTETGRALSDTCSRIKDFVGGLGEEDRAKVALHYVAHRYNYEGMPDFVKLAKELGIHRVNFTHYMVFSLNNASKSLLFVKNDYNEAFTRAKEVGAEIGIQVDGRAFFSEKANCGSREELCTSPFDEVIVDVNGEVHPCCFVGAPAGLGNAFETSFESVWFGANYERLRRSRCLKGCEMCNKLSTFDDYRAHFHPAVKWVLNDEREMLRLLDEGRMDKK